MIQMEYMKERVARVLDKGKEKGMKWCIVSYGTHPCAYICLPKGHKYYKKSYDDIPVNCHGGLTFADNDFHFNPVLFLSR